MIKKPDYFPISFDLEQGKEYRWCGCRKSANHPLCDATCDSPKQVTFTADYTESVMLCCCGQSKRAPFCDGSHVDFDDH